MAAGGQKAPKPSAQKKTVSPGKTVAAAGAAPSKKANNKTNGKSKDRGTKPYLSEPYRMQDVAVPTNEQWAHIKAVVAETLQPIADAKAHRRAERNLARRGRFPTRRQLRAAQSAKDAAADAPTSPTDGPPSKRKKEEPHTTPQEKTTAKQKSADSPNLMQGLALGINHVARAIVSQQAVLVLVERNTQPFALVQHLPELCQRHEVPLCLANGVEDLLRPLLQCRCKALAFLKSSEMEQETATTAIAKLLPLVPVPDLPWLADQAYQPLQVTHVLRVPKDQQPHRRKGQLAQQAALQSTK
ncbi:uncharacterized protein MONBRDRAFT_26466 [Monosiga brevicollis MX1]|uniref:Ribosomal protein eL8/eL30/eS12/Gadd45 domain-containing protein n=1 Tax=Monosiga brevicollis TaxID=81824 RepID=A9V2G0_MONBE|nr:uncharacterized protein MONBRDRAFT_26466 [Monosiga brevicollis MX1]EDQ88252.1 predicted protein [Monosiga brevicollis MX1]|eukprot:XP_001746845.1 hypothetical protein [Monosiga brevicollis MX1]